MSEGRVAVPVVVTAAFAVLFFGPGSYLGARPSIDPQQELAALRAEIDVLRKQGARLRMLEFVVAGLVDTSGRYGVLPQLEISQAASARSTSSRPRSSTTFSTWFMITSFPYFGESIPLTISIASP